MDIGIDMSVYMLRVRAVPETHSLQHAMLGRVSGPVHPGAGPEKQPNKYGRVPKPPYQHVGGRLGSPEGLWRFRVPTCIYLNFSLVPLHGRIVVKCYPSPPVGMGLG